MDLSVLLITSNLDESVGILVVPFGGLSSPPSSSSFSQYEIYILTVQPHGFSIIVIRR